MIVGFLALLLIAGIVHIFLGHFADGGVLLGLSGLLGLVAYLIGKQGVEAREFLDWLKANKSQIEQGWAYYKGQKVRPKSEVTRYQGCISLLIVTTRFRSRYVIDGRDAASVCLALTATSFLFGWWGFPFGFIFTPQAIYRNLRGGYKKTIAEILPRIDEEIDGLSSKQRLSTVLRMAKAEARG